jgi:hypothetical protein
MPATASHAGHAETSATPTLDLGGARDGARVLRSSPRHEGQDPGQDREDAAADGGLQCLRSVAGAVQGAADGVGERHGALIRKSREGLRGPYRLELVRHGRDRQLGDLDRHEPVRPGTAADREHVLEVLDGLRGTHHRQGALQLLDTDRLRQVPADQGQAIIRREPALPGVRLDVEGLAE